MRSHKKAFQDVLINWTKWYLNQINSSTGCHKIMTWQLFLEVYHKTHYWQQTFKPIVFSFTKWKWLPNKKFSDSFRYFTFVFTVNKYRAISDWTLENIWSRPNTTCFPTFVPINSPYWHVDIYENPTKYGLLPLFSFILTWSETRWNLYNCCNEEL